MAYIKKTREEKKAEIKTLIEDTERKINEYFESPESIKEYLLFMSKGIPSGLMPVPPFFGISILLTGSGL